HLAHHVVAEIAEDAGRHGRQVRTPGNGGLSDELAQRLQRRLAARFEDLGGAQRVSIDRGARALDAENHVRVEADHRVAAARGAAFDRLEQKAIAGALLRELQIGGNRRLEIAHEADRDEARPPGFVIGGESLEIRLQRVKAHFSASPPSAFWSAFWSMLTLRSFSSPPTYCS